MSARRAAPTGGRVSRRHLLLGLCALPLAPGLSACLLDATPATPAPPTRTPTPRPTATSTAQPVRLALPTATIAGTPPPRAVSTPLAVSDPRGGGGLIYAGRLDGRAGVVAVRAGGGGSRLLTEGVYTRLAWSPDGDRFAAIGPLAGDEEDKQVAIFTFNGRPLARFPFRGDIDREIFWSPDSQYLLCFVLSAVDRSIGYAPFSPWVMSVDGVTELQLPGRRISTPRWIARNRLLVATLVDGTLANPLAGTTPVALWTIDANGGGARQVLQGAFLPIGLSPDEATLYALADPALIDLGPPNVHTQATSLVAIELRSGQRRILARTSALVGRAGDDYQYWLAGGSVSPNGARIAFALNTAAPSSSPGTAATVSGMSVIARTAGGSPLVLPNYSPGYYPSWSPDGTKLASFRLATGTGENELRILDTVRGEGLSYPLDPAYTATLGRLAWSNDSRWVAYNGPRGLEIVATGGAPQSFPVAEDGVAPAWRPGGRA